MQNSEGKSCFWNGPKQFVWVKNNFDGPKTIWTGLHLKACRSIKYALYRPKSILDLSKTFLLVQNIFGLNVIFFIDRYIPEFLIASFSSFTRCLLGNPFINGIILFSTCLSEFPKFPNIFALETKSRKITHYFRAALL